MNLWDYVLEKIEERRREKSASQANALKIVLPFFLTALNIMFVVYGIIYISRDADARKDIENNRIVEDVMNNPGEAWEEWGQLWEIPNTTWNDLEEPFANVQQDWENRGLIITWDYMTAVFSTIKINMFRTFDNFESRLFGQLYSDFYTQGAERSRKIETGSGIALLVIGTVSIIFLIIKTIINGTFIGMFC